MKFDAERKKQYALGVLGVIAVVMLYENVFSGPSNENAPSGRSQMAPAPAAIPLGGTGSGAGGNAHPAARKTAVGRASLGTFHPRVREPRPEDRPNLATIDPTLRLDLLAKVQNVPPEGGARNLFAFSTAPVVTPASKLPKEPKIVVNGKIPGAGPTVADGPPKPPPPPAIALKYYGYSTVRGGDGRKRAFFLDGDDIIVAGENELIKKRYKVVKIGVNSVDVEDTELKNTQKLPLQEEGLA